MINLDMGLSIGKQDERNSITMANPSENTTIRFKEIITDIANETGSSKEQANEFYQAFIAVLLNHLWHGNDVELTSFMHFKNEDREAHTARNPYDGTVLHVPARRSVRVKTGSGIRDIKADLNENNEVDRDGHDHPHYEAFINRRAYNEKREHLEKLQEQQRKLEKQAELARRNYANLARELDSLAPRKRRKKQDDEDSDNTVTSPDDAHNEQD